MNKILNILLVLCLTFSFNLKVFAEGYYQEEKKMTQEDINIYKYKMERISVKQEHGKWVIIQGINFELNDMQLLKLVNNENIATKRMKDIENKQNLGAGIALGGIALGIAGGLFTTNVIKVDNGIYYGIGGIVAGLVLLALGNMVSPIISDENEHIINIDEARDAANKYNAELRKRLQIKEEIQ
ncbi:MAG: hypothetical protein U0354_08905 [Candidatus Sericytochromatia bacterium]